MKEIRKLYRDDLRMLCINRGWYTCGTNEEYEELLKFAGSLKNVRTINIVEIAENIMNHSEEISTDDPLTYICFEIAEICHSFFE